jgi:hypothetical protein
MTDNGTSHEPSLDVANWPTINEAVTHTNAARRTIERAGERGDIRRIKDAAGVYHYDPQDLEEFEAKPLGRPPSPSAEVLEETFKGSSSLLHQVYRHLERIEVIRHKAIEANLECLRRENERLSKENQSLTTGYWDAISAREKALDEKHIRDLETQVETQREKRKDSMAKVFVDKAPGILDQVLGSSADLAKAGLAVEFLKSFEPAMVETMLETDFLTPKQRELLCKLLGREMPKREQKPEPEPEPEPEAERSSIDTEGQESP